jgi:S1-C subfamily serine protease
MSTVQEQLLYTTLRIECVNESGQVFSIGTGFLLKRPVGNDQYKIYLVSNKHVLCNAQSLAVTFSTQKNGLPNLGQTMRLPIKDIKQHIVGHSNPNVDIALLDCTGLFLMFPNALYFKLVDYEMLASFEEPELEIAENVLFVGYPDDRYDVKNNLPLIRTGLISSHPKYDFNDDPVFIIDAQVFPGSSGSPVYIDLTFENMKNGQIVVGQRNLKLLGIISATMIRNNQLKSIDTTTKFLTEEILGLGIVYKATAIKELVDSMPIT